MCKEFKIIWKEMFVTYSGYYPGILTEELRKPRKIPAGVPRGTRN
jgi:hypothetical protein